MARLQTITTNITPCLPKRATPFETAQRRTSKWQETHRSAAEGSLGRDLILILYPSLNFDTTSVTVYKIISVVGGVGCVVVVVVSGVVGVVGVGGRGDVGPAVVLGRFHNSPIAWLCLWYSTKLWDVQKGFDTDCDRRDPCFRRGYFHTTFPPCCLTSPTAGCDCSYCNPTCALSHHFCSADLHPNISHGLP